MKRINGFWVDKNNNRWDDIIGRTEAKKRSSSLYNCHSCYNCENCYNCSYCINCNVCVNCDICIKCYRCHGCRNCCYCDNCDKCTSYIKNPMSYRTNRIGSRDDHTVFYYGKTKNGLSLQVVCGCFRGNLKEFEAAVLKTHAKNEVYRNQYLKEIEKVKILFELET